MGLFEQFPFTNFHEMNLDWIINKIGDIEKNIDSINFESNLFSTPADFNAANDGINDDTSAIQQCVDSGKIVILSGKYAISAPINLKNDSVIIGNNCTIVPYTLNQFNFFHVINVTNAYISNINLDGKWQNIPNIDINGDHSGIAIYDSTNVTITKCNISNFVNNGIYSNKAKNTYIENCVVFNTNFGSGITCANGSYTKINSCESHDNNKDGITMADNNSIVNSCLLYSNGKMRYDPNEPSCGIYTQGTCYNTILTNNIIYNNSFSGIESNTSYKVTITENIIYNNNEYGIAIISAKNCHVSNNTLRKNGFEDKNYCANITVYNTTGEPSKYNYVSNNYIDGENTSKYGISVINSTNNVINSNYLNGCLNAFFDNKYEENTYFQDNISYSLKNGTLEPIKIIISSTAPDSVNGSMYVNDGGLHLYYNGSWHIITGT